MECPYDGWELYFPEETFEPEEMEFRIKLIDGLVSYFQEHCVQLFEQSNVKKTRTVTLNYLEVRKNLDQESERIFTPSLRNEPEQAIACVGLAIYQVVFGNAPQFGTKKKINVRFVNYEKVTQLKNLKSNYIGKFVSIKGTVIRVGSIKPLVIKMDFICARCGSRIPCFSPDGKYTAPTKCSTSHCRGKSFEPDRASAVTIDWQKIRIQEQLSSTDQDSGRVPRTIECELSEDLVDSGVPGDVVTVCGVVKVVSTEIEKGRGARGKQNNKSMFFIYLEANSVENCKQTDKVEIIDFSHSDLTFISQIANEKNLFRLLVNSLCPTIYGHEMVKAGLILTLFGGSQKEQDQDELPVRADSHMLIVGDPGLGKSQLLQAVTNIVPRGVYVCGSYSSSSGLTVTLHKEKGSGDYALEAGALVLSDQGICCIDEFDKMGKEHQALLEAMEQQSISIAKAGIVCSLPARTSVIAAANPVGGHYNRAKTVSENIKLSDVLLSRFDLIFILLDKPDEERDHLISEHVMSIHSDRSAKRKRVEIEHHQDRDAREENEAEEDQPLSKRLRLALGETPDLIPPILLRKYIGYARKYCNPKLTPEACKVLQTFYMTLRSKHKSVDGTPVTTRQLESLIRLSEARAKLELRREVTEQDAKEVVEVMKNSLFDIFEDEYGNLDLRRGTGMSKAGQAKSYVAALAREAQRTQNGIFTMQQLLEMAQKTNMSREVLDHFDDFIDNLNTQSYLLKKSGRTYALATFN